MALENVNIQDKVEITKEDVTMQLYAKLKCNREFWGFCSRGLLVNIRG